jgi:hypothetical protein
MELFNTSPERQIINLIGKAAQAGNVQHIKPYLHSNAILTRQRRYEHIWGSRAFIAKWASEIKALGFSEIEYFVHPLTYRNNHFLILKDKNNKSRPVVVACVMFKNGRIILIQLHSCKGSKNRYFDRYYFEMAKTKHLNERMFRYASHLDIKNVVKCVKKGANINSLNPEGESVLAVMTGASLWDHKQINRFDWVQDITSEEIRAKVLAMKEKMKARGYFQHLMHESSSEPYNYQKMNWGASESILWDYIIRLAEITQEDRIAMLKKLIDLGADVNHFSKSPKKGARPPIYFAVFNRESKVVEFLLNHKADPKLYSYPLGCGYISLYERTYVDLMYEETVDFERDGILFHDGKDAETQEKEINELRKIILQLK